jgi:hypothetical protein
MKSQKVLHFLKWLLLSFLCACILVELYALFVGHYNWRWISLKRIVVISLLISIIIIKNKFTWVFALLLFLYGMLSIVFAGNNVAEYRPIAAEFSANTFRFANTADNTFEKIGKAFPLLFYFLAFLSFATPNVRKWYGFNSFKGKSQSSYLR